MSTSVNPERRMLRGHFPTSALAKSVTFDQCMIQVTLMDGRVIGVPIAWFPLLRDATADQQTKYEIGGGGISLIGKRLTKTIPSPGSWPLPM